MLLRNLYQKSVLTSRIAARTMAIKPRKDMEDEYHTHMKEAEEKLISGYKKKHKYDIDHPVVTEKQWSQAMRDFHGWDKDDGHHYPNLKAGDQERTEFYTNISKIDENDHEVIKKVKSKIKKLLDQELEFLGFKDELKEMEKNKLIEDTYKDVEERKSFFFKYDNKKLEKNKQIYDIRAPGNVHRKISYIAPHEHIHPQHHIDVENLTEDDITTLYAYYTYYIDFHISQVRREVTEKSYIPPQFSQISFTNPNFRNHKIDNKFIEYYFSWREPTRKWRSQTQEIDFQKEIDNLPVNHHPDHKAFSEHEVEWTEEQKFPHVANRKGYPIFGESPLERIVGLERAPAHPSYQLQAFVQTPSMDPDPSLNFERAETVYENQRVGEWVRMWKWVLTCTLPFWPAFFTFEIYQADGAPSLQWLADMGSWHQVPTQFQDSGDWNLEKVRYCDEHDYMNSQYVYKRTILRPAHTFYQITLLSMLHGLNFDYVTKMQYNKDRDLVFVYKPDGWFTDKEYVYEVHHLESMVPGTVSAYPHLGMGHKDGITNLLCMDTKQSLKFYNDPKYWNLELRDDFLSQTRSMWPNL